MVHIYAWHAGGTPGLLPVWYHFNELYIRLFSELFRDDKASAQTC